MSSPENTTALGQGPSSFMEEPRLLRAALDGTTDSVFVKDLQGLYIAINAAGASYVGRRPDEILGRDDRALFPPETAAAVIAHDRAVLESGEPHAFEVTLPVAGQPRIFFSTKTPYRDVDGRIVGLIGISRDITERKQAEEARHESEERLARILESAMDAIVTIDAGGRITLFNAAAERVFRLKASEAAGTAFARLVSDRFQAVLGDYMSAGDGARAAAMWMPEGLTASLTPAQLSDLVRFPSELGK